VYKAFTDQERQLANEVDIVSYLRSKGEHVKKNGKEYLWEAPTGAVTISGNKWFSQYELKGGYSVEFAKKFFDLSYPEAVSDLLGDSGMMFVPQTEKKKEKKEFVVPEANDNNNRLFYYLTKERLISRNIVNFFVGEGLIYEDKDYHNAVFVGKDEDGNIRHIQKRATHPSSTFKGNVEGSDSKYSFNYIGESEKLFVFEAPIDMLAYLTLYPQNWKNNSYVALCSTADHAVVRILENYPNIKDVYLCLDHDTAGIAGAKRIADKVHEMGDYEVWRMFPKCKDWDEDLYSKHGRDAIEASEGNDFEELTSGELIIS